MGNLFILFDFENLSVYAQQKLSLNVTNIGLDKLIEVCKANGTMSVKNNLMVAAIWRNCGTFRDYFANKFADVIEVYDKGSNTADGYLIVKAMQRRTEFQEGDSLIIISGDGVYAGFARYALSQGLKVFVYGWKESIAELFKTLPDTTIFELENIFDFASEQYIENKWFEPTGVTPLEYAIIARAVRLGGYFYAVASANKLCISEKNVYLEINTFHKATSYFEECEKNGLLIGSYVPNPKNIEGKPIKQYTLNEEHPKVKFVTSRVRT